MSKYFVLVMALCALVAAVSAIPYPFPQGGAAAPKETLKGAEAVYLAGYGGVPYVGGYYPTAYHYYG